MAPPVGVEGRKQPPLLDHLPHAPEAGGRAFLHHEEHRVVLVGGIVHRHNQVPLPSAHPLMRRAILVQHHAGQRRPLPTLPVLASTRRPRYQPRLLQPVLDPAIAAGTPIPAIPRVEVLDVPALVPAVVQLPQTQHLIHRRPPVRILGQPFVNEPPKPLLLVAVDVAPEGPVVNPQQPRRLFLSQSPYPPTLISLFKSHSPGLL